MIPQRVYLKGFMSYREEQTLLFDKAPLWVLAGPNGSGKSSVFDAITFALYGRHRAGAQRANELINHNSDNLIVEFDFIIDDATYRVRRTLSKKSSRATREACIIATDKNGKTEVRCIQETDSEEGFKIWVNETIGLNYETFTSSILLLQGQSEKLLASEPKDRYKILTELIDLSLYQKLSQKADEKRKECEQEASTLNKQLQAIPEVTDEKIKNLQKQIEQITKDYNEINELIEKWTELLGEAKNWEKLKKELKDNNQKLEDSNKLLEQTAQIKAGWERYKELKQIIPIFKELKQKQDRIIEQESKIQNLSLLISTSSKQLVEMEKEKDSIQNLFDTSKQTLEELEKRETTLLRQIEKASNLIEKLEEIEKLKQDIQEINLQLETSPKNLEDLIAQASSKLKELADRERALPWLKQALSTHKALQQIPQQQEVICSNLSLLEVELTNSGKEIQSLNDRIETLNLKENELTHNITSQSTLYEQLQKRVDDFAKVSSKPTCDLCGQLISEEHRLNEEVRLKTEIQRLTDSLSLSKSDLEEIKQQKFSILEQEKNLQTQHKKFSQTKQQNEIDLERLELEQRDKKALLKSSINNLPAAFYSQFIGSTNGEIDLNKVALISVDTLNEIDLSIKNRKNYEDELDQLRKAREKTLQNETKKEHIENLLSDKQVDLDMDELEKARDQQPILLMEQQELELQIEEQRQIGQQTQQKLNELVTEIRTISSSLQTNRQSEAIEIELKKEVENSCQEVIKRIPETWKLQTTDVTDIFLNNLNAEYINLTPYVDEYSNLQNTEIEVPKLKKEIEKLEKQVREIPTDAHKPAAELLPMLNGYKKTREKIVEDQSEAKAELRKDQQNYKQLIDLRSKKQEANNNYLTYKILADLLGRNGLQMHLLREAEKAIVDYANEVLDSLSRGKLRLTLQGTDGSTQSESNKALDLVVCNYEIGNQPMSVSFASGSQRFRIAVSLALAIGRYVGQHAGRIKSVIIDEGFGSLDKNGRDDMIQELSILQQQLAKIILVSHQEDFTNAFTNGYTIKLTDATSQVQLFENN